MMLSVNNFKTFAGKEFTENLRTKKLLALACVFILLALMSVLTARFMVEILTAALSAEEAFAGMVIPDPVWTDSYAQLYSNLTQIGMLAFVMLFMGVILHEKSTGTIDLMLAKGLTPTVFVLSKYAVAGIIALAALYFAVFTTYVYTLLLFDYGGQIGNILIGAVPLGVFMLMMLALTLMWSAIAKSTAISAMLGIVTFFLFIPIEFIPVVGLYSPSRLLGHGLTLSAGGSAENLFVQIIAAIAVSVLALAAAVVVLRRREG